MKTILALIIALGAFAFFPATAEAGDSKHKKLLKRYILERYYEKHHRHHHHDCDSGYGYGYRRGYVDRHHPGARPRYDYYGHRVDSHGHHVDRYGRHR
jgi:hypothetical protein